MTDRLTPQPFGDKPNPTTPRVLVVDDHEELAENVVEILTSADNTSDVLCVAVRTAEQAIVEAERAQFELALIDLHLPDAHGLELAEKLRVRCPHVQIVIITGDVTVESAIDAVDKGVFAYVLKPFRPQQLVETTSRAIERSRLLAEREQLRNELERSERRNREVIDGVPAFVTALDESGRIVVWNSQLEKVTGFTRQEMLGTAGQDILSRDGTLRLRLKGGGHRSVRWKLAAVPKLNSSPNVTYGLGVDVTDESEMQQRTLRAERLAAVGTLAAGLAHEVRNPLNSATLQLQMLERKVRKGSVEPDAIRDTVQIVRGEIERLEHLVKDFLAFAKPQVFEPQPGDLNRVVEGVVALVAVEASRARVQIRKLLEPNLGLVPLEDQSIKQVVLNLTRNAIEALQPQGGGNLTLVTRPAPDAAAVVLAVIDDGPGFDEKTPIFDAFYTTKEGGTGLGLSIAHRIVTEHGGTIGVETKTGRTCFTIQLPQPAAAGPSALPARKASS
jgi:nitrogen-specific signal transduction histidine kinase/ActR/RegA family two-component response regulator